MMAVASGKAQLPPLRRSLAAERAIQVRLMLAAERALEARLAQILAAAGRRAANAHRHGESVDAALSGLADELARVLAPSLAQIARTFGVRLVQAPKAAAAFAGIETKAFEDLDQAIRTHIFRRTARRVVGVAGSTREAIRRAVREGIAENLGQEEIARRIVEATSGQIGMARARRIARTEVHNAAMYGQQAAAEASPLEFEKVWLATEDARTRESHAKANGQRVPLDQRFELESPTRGRVYLWHPGDASGPPEEVINCRCVCNYEPLPALKDPARPKPSRRLDEPAEPFNADPAEIRPDLPPPFDPGTTELVLEDIPPPPETSLRLEQVVERLIGDAIAALDAGADVTATARDLASALEGAIAHAVPGVPYAAEVQGMIAELRRRRWSRQRLGAFIGLQLRPGTGATFLSPELTDQIADGPTDAPDVDPEDPRFLITVDADPQHVAIAEPEPEAPARPLPDPRLALAAREIAEDALGRIFDRDGLGPTALAAAIAADLRAELATAAPGSRTASTLEAAIADLEARTWSRDRLRDRLEHLVADLEEDSP